MKKFVSILLAVLLASALFTGCGLTTDDYDPNVLTIGFENAGLGDTWLHNLVKKFEEEYGVKVEVDGDHGFTSTIGPKLQSNTEIKDIFFGLETIQMQWAASGYFEPLDDLYESEVENGKLFKEIIKPEYIEPARINNIYGNHLYTIPWTESAGGLYYNVKMFQQYGLEIPTTFEELVNLCKKIIKLPVNDDTNPDNDIRPFVWSGDITNYWDFFVENWWVQILGIDGFNEFCKYDTPEYYNPENKVGAAKQKALEYFKELVVDHPEFSMPNCASKPWQVAQMDFVNGKAAMIANGAWLENEMKDAMPPDFEMALMPTPFVPEAKKDANGEYIRVNFTIGNDFIAIPKAAKNKELAKKFLLFMTREENLRQFVKDTGTPRPYIFNTDGIEGLTTCQQSVLEIWKTSINFTFKTTSPLATTGQAQVWKLGYPYSKMLMDDETPASIIAAEYNFVKSEWSKWLEYAGIGQS